MNVALFDCGTRQGETTPGLAEPRSVCTNWLDLAYKLSLGACWNCFQSVEYSFSLFIFLPIVWFHPKSISPGCWHSPGWRTGCWVVYNLLDVYHVPRPGVRWSTEPSEPSRAGFILTETAVHWSLPPLITASVSQSRWREKYIFSMENEQSYYSALLTTNQFLHSVFCLQLDEMLNKMGKMNQACESGCQSSPTSVLWIGAIGGICDSSVCTLSPTPEVTYSHSRPLCISCAAEHFNPVDIDPGCNWTIVTGNNL